VIVPSERWTNPRSASASISDNSVAKSLKLPFRAAVAHELLDDVATRRSSSVSARPRTVAEQPAGMVSP
jgi:hypothetical protein